MRRHLQEKFEHIIEEYNASYKVQHQTDYINYEKAIVILDNIQRAQSNVKIYKSATLEFVNKSYDPVAAAIDLISGLTILVDPAGFNGSYLLYDESGMITNAADAVRKRFMYATYQSLITGEEILDKAEKIVWYFPLEGSMIYPPQLGTEYSEYEVYSELTEEEIAALELPCKYCRIERAIPEVLEGDAGEEVARQTEQIFRIKDFYTQTATNNTVYCTVFKNGKQYQSEQTLIFGTSGTCGTDATFLLQMMEWDEDKQQPTTHPVSALTIGKSVAIVPKFYDYNRNDITEEYLGSHLINYTWDSQEASGEGALQLSSTDVKPNYARVWVDSGATIEKCQYYILKASVSWAIVKYMKDEDGKVQVDADGNPMIDEQDENLETRDVRLTTFLPIPVRISDEYTQAVGPTQIIYNKDGANPAYYNSPFVLYKNGEPVEASWMSQCREYLKSNPKDARILNYYPSLDAEGNLTPKSMYLSDGKPYAVEALADEPVFNEDGTPALNEDGTPQTRREVVWTQPILIIKNKYASAMLNAWDGELCIDKENGTIMATMVGAGKKEDDNTFSGVLMGDVEGGADFDERNHKGLGLYGFNHGEQSFGFNIDGTAFIGKAGRGRINLNGNKGTIESGSYIKNVAGMQIDLDGDETDKTASSLYAYGGGGAIELDTNDNKPLFVIRSTPAADGKKLVFIGRTDTNTEDGSNRDFYIQSENYVKDTDGTHINLKTGKIYIYNKGNKEGELPSYIRIDGDGNPYLQIHDGQTTVRENGTDVFYASKSKYQLMSVNYEEGKSGIYINLQGGSIEARKGNIGGWAIDSNKISAGNIELRAEGSMYGGTGDNTWYIDKDGKASFQNLSVTDSGTIGPFTVSSSALTYTSGEGVTFQLGTSGLSLNGNAFKVGLDGTTLISGDLTVKGNTSLEGTLTVAQGDESGGGGGSIASGDGKSYGFKGSSGWVGPWKITPTAIYTGESEADAVSLLGASGTLRLSNAKYELEFTDSGLTLGDDNTKFSVANDTIKMMSSSSGNGGSNYLSVSNTWIEGYLGGERRLWLGSVTGIWLGSSGASISIDYGTGSGSGTGASDGIVFNSAETNFSILKDKIVVDKKECTSAESLSIGDILKNGGTLEVHKGLIVGADVVSTNAANKTDIEITGNFKLSGYFSAYKKGTTTLAELGNLAWLDKVEISSASFKYGGSTISMGTPEINGDTVTYTGTVSTYAKGSTAYTVIGEGDYYYPRVWNDSTKSYEPGSSTVYRYKASSSTVTPAVADTKTITATITVAAVAETPKT